MKSPTATSLCTVLLLVLAFAFITFSLPKNGDIDSPNKTASSTTYATSAPSDSLPFNSIDNLTLEIPNSVYYDKTITTEQALCIWANLVPQYLNYVNNVASIDDLGNSSICVSDELGTRFFYECINTDYPTIQSRISLITSIFSIDYADLLTHYPLEQLPLVLLADMSEIL